MLHFLPVLIPSCPLFFYLNVELFQSSVEVLTIESCRFFCGKLLYEIYFLHKYFYSDLFSVLVFWGTKFSLYRGGASYRHTCSGGDPKRQQGPGPSQGSRAPWGTLALHVLSHGCSLILWACTLQWSLLTGARLVGFKCTVGRSSHEHMHGVGVSTLSLY